MEWRAHENGRQDASVTRIRGLPNSVVLLPGAYAPGFMPAPASQAQAGCAKLRRERLLARKRFTAFPHY